MIDKNGRPIKPGDIIRIYHYTDRRTRRRCYLYMMVVLVTDDLQVSKSGTHLFALSLGDLWKSGSLQKAHKLRLDVAGEFEIIDGLCHPSRKGDYLETWYERPKEPQPDEVDA